MRNIKYKVVTCHGHPLATKYGLVRLHRKVLYEKIGPGEHPCHWCGETVRWMNGNRSKDSLVSDHVDGDTQNNSSNNLVPSCNFCNMHRERGEGRIRSGEPVIIGTNGKVTRAALFLCCICGKSYLSRYNLSGIPYVQTCSRACTSEAKSRATIGIPKFYFLPPTAKTVWMDGCRREAVTVTCKECGGNFDLAKARIRNGRGFLCSTKCRAAWIHHIHPRKMTTRLCAVCDKEFSFPAGRTKFDPARCCSKSCAAILSHRERQQRKSA